MSLKQQCNSVLSSSSSSSSLPERESSPILKVRTALPEIEVEASGEKKMLSIAIESLKSVGVEDDNSRNVVKLEKQTKKINKQIKDDSETEAIENELSESPNGQIKEGNNQLRTISLDEIAWHDTPDDCWFAIYDYVYDCTNFIRNHPGGEDVLLEYAGRDATLAFIGAGHSKFAQKILERYLIGELPPNERMFRIPGGVKVYGI